MPTYYHGSKNANLKKLSLDKSADGWIYAHSNYYFSMLYAASSCRFWRYIKEEEKLYIVEHCENMIEKLYKGRKCYIYKVKDEIKNFEKSDDFGAIRTKQELDLFERETIEDSYETIMKLYSEGKIGIWFYKDMRSEVQDFYVNKLKSTFTKEVMQVNKKQFKKVYKILTNLFPYLKV